MRTSTPAIVWVASAVEDEAGAGHFVIEAQCIHPTAVEDVVEGGGIAGVRVIVAVPTKCVIDFAPAGDGIEMCVERARVGVD